MKYLVTRYFIGRTGGLVFNPAHDAEVFDNYFSALRWLVQEKRLAKKVSYDVDIEWNHVTSKLGREWLLTMTETKYFGHVCVELSRINENGLH